MRLEENLGRIVLRHEELQARLAVEAGGGGAFARMAQELAELAPVVEAVHALRAARSELAGLAALAETEADEEVLALVGEEREALETRIAGLERSIRLALLPVDEADRRSVVLEIRAGTGGDEATLFAADLMEMYRRYALARNWTFEPLGMSQTGVGGVREVQALIRGAGVFARLKFESGVHRVQRVPATESQGRIHTSAATVAILPEAEEVDVAIAEKDLRIDTFRSSGAGGQHVNKTDSAVRITHLPTGIVVSQQSDRSQHKNRAQAMKILRSRLFDLERRRQADEQASRRREQVGSGDRSERIRTYNFPQGRLTDHRINLTLYRLEEIVSGQALDDVIEPLIAESRAAMLAELA